MLGKESQHSFAKKWLFGGIGGKTCGMMWVDRNGIPANMENCHVPPWRWEGDPVWGVLVVGHMLKAADSFIIRKINPGI